MDILTSYINPVIFGICLIIGYLMKHWLKAVDNQFILTVAAAAGIVIALWINQWEFAPQVLQSE